MDKTDEKLKKISYMVMKEADKQGKEIVLEAGENMKEAVDKKELEYLQQAYEHIQAAIGEIYKESNERVSKAVLESKHLLFGRRDEIIDEVFRHITDRITGFKQTEGYAAYMERLVEAGLGRAGGGDVTVFADVDDIDLLEGIKKKTGSDFPVRESDSRHIGGIIVINRTRRLVYDYSFVNTIHEERAAFLEKYRLSIE